MNRFPDDKKFAFTIFDDTDLSTVENIEPIYRLLDKLGIRTTKSVWPLASVEGARFSGSSLQDPEYLEFVRELQSNGFEIALHNVRNNASVREEVAGGLKEFHRLIGHYPRVHANHSNNRENIYWGAARFSTLALLYKAATVFRRGWPFEGENESSKYFWGDLCRQHISYVRNFVFREINLDRISSSMPYADPRRPYVNAWFSSCDGADKDAFCALLSEKNQDRLEAEGGVCIVYTHLACGFVKNGRVDSEVAELLQRLASKQGWFVPVSTLLDRMHEWRGTLEIAPSEIAAMERRWLADRVVIAFERGVRRLRELRGLREKRQPTGAKPRVVHITSVHEALDVRIFYKECQSLACAGYEVVLLSNDPQDFTQAGVSVRGLGQFSGRLQRITSKMWRMGREAFRLNAEIYHIHDPELLPLALVLRIAGKQGVYDIHEDLPRTVLYKHYIPQWLRRPLMRFIQIVENTAARLMTGLVTATPVIGRRFERINRNTVVVNNFPIMHELAPVTGRPWEERSCAAAYIGGIAVERGARELLAAIDLINPPNARLKLAGWFSDPTLQPELEKAAGWQRVDWYGLQDRTQIAELLGSVRLGLVVLHPEDNFVVSQPVKLFEYMAAGIPVVLSDFPLWRSMIEEEGCGLLVDPLDPAAIANAMTYLLTHDDEAKTMGQRGRAAVEKRFNWDAEERKLLAFYSQLNRADFATEALREIC
jgi:glycosyltransferase involved in cell wall biosynthesis